MLNMMGGLYHYGVIALATVGAVALALVGLVLWLRLSPEPRERYTHGS